MEILTMIRKSALTAFAVLTMMSGTAYAQTRESVSGTVTDPSGTPIAGVTVLEKGTSNGVATDMDGKFTLSVPAPSKGKTISFSCIGYESSDVVLTGADRLDVILNENSDYLDDVVVVGYGTVKKTDLTGSVARANTKDFENAPVANMVEALQGTVPGLNIGQATAAGTTPSISIRGKHTLSGSTDVLIVLDGIPYKSSLSSINPNDIESVDVLKDASASAIYGAQAANGVLLITTKKGKTGAPKIALSTSYSITTPAQNERPMNRAEYLQRIRNLYYDKAYIGPDYTTPNPDFDLSKYIPDAPMLDPSQPDGISALDYDWYGEGTQTGRIFEARVNLSGATDKVSYLISYEHMNQKGVIKYDEAKRNSIRLNLEVKPLKWLTIGTQAFGSFVNQDGAEPSLGTLVSMSPLLKPYDENGKIITNPFNTLDTNPFIAADVDDKDRHYYFFANFYGEVKLPLKGLTYRVNYGNNLRFDQHYKSNVHGASQTGEAYKEHTTYYDYTIDNILSYKNNFGKHGVDVTLVYGANARKNDFTSAKAQKFERLTLGYNKLDLGVDQYTSSSAWQEQFLYQMARLNYNYDNRYLLTATVRRDGFSGFGENNKTAVFPSVALAWKISEENFFNVSWINDLKIRAGYGVSGNMLSSYQSVAQVSTQSGYVFGDGGTTETSQRITRMANDDLKWERTAGYNLGLDFGLLNNRISGSVEYFNTKTNDLLYSMTIPSMTGFTSITTNLGQVANQGVEFTLTSHNISRRDFEWITTLTVSHNKNRIVTLNGNDLDGDGKEDDLIASGLFIGESLSTIYGYKTDGIYQLNDEIPTGYYPGNYRIVDVNKDGKIDVNDRTILGQSDPSARIGLLNKFRYKNFSLSIFLNSAVGFGNDYLGSNSSFLHPGNANNVRWNIISKKAELYWSPSNPDGIYAMSTKSGTITPTRYENRSFLRIQDVNLSYNFPKAMIQRIGISDLSIFFYGRNLFTFTKWHGTDPETGSTYGGRPVYRNFSFGLNLTF